MEKSWQQCRGSKPLGVRSESVTGCHFPNGEVSMAECSYQPGLQFAENAA